MKPLTKLPKGVAAECTLAVRINVMYVERKRLGTGPLVTCGILVEVNGCGGGVDKATVKIRCMEGKTVVESFVPKL
jgi:hypothetical protein